ncbi:MAG: hypothetical protein M3N53_11385 [Actinomycetota bacterium]|nr:hypothetical protein [Actinomycetota bacterium]
MASGAFLLATLFPLAVFAPPACAGEGGSAALVVDTGESDQRLCVALPEDEVSGLELIVLASEQHGLSYKFGFGGEAVCMLAGVGPTGDDCFEDYPDFWGYWRGDGSGGWTWSGSGAGSTTVTSGDVEGWSWGSGNDGSTHPPPPITSFASVCDEVSEQEPDSQAPREPDETRTGPRSQARAPNEPQDAAEVASADEDVRARPRQPRSGRPRRARRPSSAKGDERERVASRGRTPADASVEGPPDEVQAAVDTSSEGSGPPAAGVAALGAAAAVAGAGLLLARRRRSSRS